MLLWNFVAVLDLGLGWWCRLCAIWGDLIWVDVGGMVGCS